jgi:hypothetical protein
MRANDDANLSQEAHNIVYQAEVNEVPRGFHRPCLALGAARSLKY